MAIRTFLTLVAIAALTACGGGGSSTPSAPAATGSAEGFYSGTTSNGWGVDIAILESGDTWGIYYTPTAIYGALSGSTTWTATTLSGSGSDFYFPNRSLTPGTYSGTYTPKQSIRVTTSGGVTATATYASLYDAPASLGAVAGTYSGQGITRTSAVTTQSITISTAGAISGGIVGCSLSGTATPRASGKGVFNVTVTLTGNLCAAGNGSTMQGVAVYDPASRRLVTMGLNPAKTDGFFYVGTR
jgi:hypothetical protein